MPPGALQLSVSEVALTPVVVGATGVRGTTSEIGVDPAEYVPVPTELIPATLKV